MKLKIVFIFFITILIPTFCLAYFGLLAVRSEKSIIEKNLQQKYKAMANIVHDEIQAAVAKARLDQIFLDDEKDLKSLLKEQAMLFPNEVYILDKKKGSGTFFENPAFIRPIKGFPYYIGVYEKYPIVAAQLQEKQQQLYAYITMIIFSTIFIVTGGGYTVWALAREWRQAKLKSAFVAQLSHDIRKPLTSIRMFTEMLQEGQVPDEEKRNEYYHIINDESNKLTDLANSILDFSRIESGKVKYNFQEINIIEEIKDTIKQFKTHTPNRTVHFQKEGLTSFLLKCDPQAIRQMLMNLLTNADKYSSSDKEIFVNLKKGSDLFFEIEVIDQGIGISQCEQKKIFQKFYRVFKKVGDIQGVEGTGLGLTLVKYIAQAHGGNIKVKSEEGKGSKFIVTIKGV